jgi:hypothetical protein
MPARIDIGRNSSYRQGTDSDTRGLEQSEEVMLTSEVSDEALESAAGTGGEKAGKYTLFYCTALDLCPGP